MNIAFEGCFHGNLEEVYKTMQFIEEQQGIKIDALVSCGDFQAIRNKPDMYSMKCPEKYLEIGTFHEYYSGVKKAPYLTIFVGGNHEASNHNRELHFGGWVAPNIYFLGASNVILLKKGSKSLRLGGISGIFSPQDFLNSQLERFPFNKSGIVSSYHQKQIDVLKLSNLNRNSKIDVFLSHDWPSAVVNYGDVDTLLRIKKYFEKDVRENNLGSSPLNYILDSVRPTYWISGHLHVKYAALYPHSKDPLRNETANDKTMFLALDKCLPHRDFLQVVPFGREQTWRLADEEGESQKSQNIELFYDEEWLVLQKSTIEITNQRLPQDFFLLKQDNQVVLKDKDITTKLTNQILKNQDFFKDKDLRLPNNFYLSAQSYSGPQEPGFAPDKVDINQQTLKYLQLLGVDPDIFSGFLFYNNEKKPFNYQKFEIEDPAVISIAQHPNNAHRVANKEEINLDQFSQDDEDQEDEDSHEEHEQFEQLQTTQKTVDTNSIIKEIKQKEPPQQVESASQKVKLDELPFL